MDPAGDRDERVVQLRALAEKALAEETVSPDAGTWKLEPRPR
jgi:hypothetical protein